MRYRIQSEGFITPAQTGGDIPPNWGHQSSCCCVLSSFQISLSFFLIYSLSLLPLHILSPSLALSLLLGSSLISSLRRPPSFAFQVVALCRSSPAFPSGKGEREREGERVGEKRERREARGENVICS